MTGRLHLPVPALIAAGPAYRGHGLFMPLLFLAAALLAGPAWCSHLCYLGAWDDRCSRLLRRPPRPLPAWTRGAQPAALALTLGAALILRTVSAPTSVAAVLAVLFGLGGVAVMLAVSTRLGRMVHCTAYCPMGFLAAILGRLSPWRLRIATGCVQCGACSTVCRYGALEPDHLARGRPGPSCTLCGDCLAACPRSLLAYRFPGLSPRTARAAFLVTVLSLHAAFLGMARI